MKDIGDEVSYSSEGRPSSFIDIEERILMTYKSHSLN
jgi:hypothetical protein